MNVFKSINSIWILSIIIILTGNFCSQNLSEQQILERLPQNLHTQITAAIEKSGENKKELLSAITDCPDDQIGSLGFLLSNMPERDLRELNKEFLLTNNSLAHKVLDSVQWAENIPHDIFLNYILPYVNLHERRDNWREDFYNRFLPLVKDIPTPGEAAVKLNNEIWDIINVKYSTKRAKADQSPYESMESGLASCTGLSIILIDACRAVGIPARFVGVPLWADHSGNHSWVEIWDNGWHYIGAGEPGPLDKTWFGERAEHSNDSEWKYSIYAASFKKTNVIFPPLFDTTATYVYADIVTDRYSKQVRDDGLVSLAIRLFEYKNGPRIAGSVTISEDGKLIDEGSTRDETYDYNDFLIFKIQPKRSYQIRIEVGGQIKEELFTTDDKKYQFYEVYFKE